MFESLQQFPTILSSGGAKAIFFFIYLVAAWVLMPLWAHSTWRSRGSVYVRVRQPVWLLADISLILLIMTVICVKEIRLSTDRNLPCWQSNSAAALAVVWVPGVNLSRSSHLWYAFSIREVEKDDRVYLLQSFRTGVTGILACMGLLAVILVNSGAHLCFSDICTEVCYWNCQYLVLMPVCGSLTMLSAFSWVRLFRAERFERLGLNAEFWRTNFIVVPLLVFADLLTILMDAKVIPAEPHGHALISTVWLVLPTSRFIVLHVLPSLTYGYSPYSAFPRWAKHCRKLTGRRSRMVTPLTPHSAVSPHTTTFTLGMLSTPSTNDNGPTAQSASSSDSPREEDTSDPTPGELQPQHAASARIVGPEDKDAQSPSTAAPPSSPSPSPSSPSSPPRSPPPLPPLPPPRVPASLATLTLGDLLSSGDEWLLKELLSFCRSLFCDHWVQLLLTLHPYCSPSPSPLAPPPLPLRVVLAVYQVFLCPRAPFFVPVDGQVLHAVHNFCAPRLIDYAPTSPKFKKTMGNNLLHALNNDHASTVRNLTATLKRHKTQGSVRGVGEEEEEEEEGEGDGTAEVTKLFKLAYLEVQRLVSQEAWPLFKAHMRARSPMSKQGSEGSRIMELRSAGSFKGGNGSPRPFSQPDT